MIENLDGIFETVNYKKRTTLKLYDNVEYEDYPMHWHPAIEIIMPTDNYYTLNFGNADVLLEEGDICFVCPGCIHAIVAPETGRRIIFQPNTNFLRNMNDIELLLTLMSPYTIVTAEKYPDIYDRLKELLISIREEYLDGQPFSEVSIYSKVFEIFVLLGKKLSDKNLADKDENFAAKEEYASVLLDICNYISEHCSEDLKLSEVADMSGFSKFYFERLFKQFTGTSFYKYVNQKRIAKAQELLIEPGNSVTDVALSCGFTSISSFIRMFKLQKGCTPTDFKNMYWEIRRGEQK